MGLSRRSQKGMSGVIWPGFVDAMGSLLIVLIFLLTVFMIVQSVLRDTINQQGGELDSLSSQVAQLADALGLQTTKAEALSQDLTLAQAEGQRQTDLITSLTGQLASRQSDLDAAQARITSFEAQVLALMSERDTARSEGARLQTSVTELEAARATLITEQEAMRLALASARTEIDAAAESARLAAAQREAIEAMLADLRAQSEKTGKALTDSEAARLASSAAADALRARLEQSTTELTALSLALEDQRKQAEDTLTQLAAADAARQDLDARLAAALLAQQASAAELEAAKQDNPEQVRRDLAAAIAAKLAAETAQGAAMTEAERRAALLATAENRLSQETARSQEGQRQVALLNEQVATLRGQLTGLQDLLSDVETADSAKRLQLESLGTQLNTALAQVASEQKRRAEMEESERQRLEAENQNLERFRSEFFGQLRDVLSGRDGVRVVGDRFVFSSEVLFTQGSADLAPEGRAQIARVAATLAEAAKDIPEGIDWILRVDGHTDDAPLSGFGEFRDNWELSQARALSVVRFMQSELGFPPERLAATGFGEYRPVVADRSPEGRALNRRIELKLTER